MGKRTATHLVNLAADGIAWVDHGWTDPLVSFRVAHTSTAEIVELIAKPGSMSLTIEQPGEYGLTLRTIVSMEIGS